MAAEGLLQTCTPPGNAAGSADEAGAQGEAAARTLLRWGPDPGSKTFSWESTPLQELLNRFPFRR